MSFHIFLSRTKHLLPFTSLARLYSNLSKQIPLDLRKCLSQNGIEDVKKIRNVGIIAHIDAGKTTTTERMLYYSGFTRHLGDVDDGDTVMDYMEQERDRGITITSAAITFHWKKHKINLIDTPGHVDFTVEVERSLRVLDGVVIILDAAAGVEAQTMTVWRQADKHNLPSVIYLNKLDKSAADINKCLTSVSTKLGLEPFLITFPFCSKLKDFSGFIDIIDMNKYIWNMNKSPDGVVFTSEPIDKNNSLDLWNKAMDERALLVGRLADFDEELAEEVLANDCVSQVSALTIRDALRKATWDRHIVPVFCGSSLKNKGVQLLMDGIKHYLPSPTDRKLDITPFYGTDLCALAFKTVHDRQKKPLTFFRIYSGHLKSGSEIYNVNRNTKEKISRLYQVYADEFRDISEGFAGNIVCASGLKETITGDTITSSAGSASKAKTAKWTFHRIEKEGEVPGKRESDQDKEQPILAGLNVPSPVFFCSVEPPSLAAQKDLDLALECLQREDPSLKVEINKDTEQTILCGMGELHLEIIKQRILKEFKVDVNMGPLQIAYKETITSDISVQEMLSNMVGGQRQHVAIGLSLYQNESCHSFKHVLLDRTLESTYQNSVKFWRHHLPAIESGIMSGLSYGPILSFPVINVDVTLYQFEVERGTTQASVAACASMCMQKALRQASMALLEPMMNLEITTQSNRVSAVHIDLAKRRSRIINEVHNQDTTIIHAVTPLSELKQYSTQIRKLTSGNTSFSMELSHYEKMNEQDQKKAFEIVTGFAPD